jgi:hypothetical protein
MTNQSVDLTKVFSEVTKTLKANKQDLNTADTYNKDHGINMVKTFSTITKALTEKKGSEQGEALAYAAQVLSKKTASGSSQLYAKGLQQAAQQVRGKNIDANTGVQLLQALLSAGQTPNQSTPQSGAGDLLSSLLGGGQNSSQSGGMGDLLGSLLGGGHSGSQTDESANAGDFLGNLLSGGQSSQPASGSGDLLSSLLGGLTGSQQNQQSGGLSDGLDIGDLLTAGMAFMQSKQSGADTMNSLVAAFVAASGMGKTQHRQQSTQLVANSFLQALKKFAK